MVRIGLVVVALILGISVIFGIGLGVGIVHIGAHGLEWGRDHDGAVANNPAAAVSADEMLRQKGISVQNSPAPVAAQTPKTDDHQQALAHPQPEAVSER